MGLFADIYHYFDPSCVCGITFNHIDINIEKRRAHLQISVDSMSIIYKKQFAWILCFLNVSD